MASSKASTKKNRPQRHKAKKAKKVTITTRTTTSSSKISPPPGRTRKVLHIDAFFAGYPKYSYDPTQPIMEQFKRRAEDFKRERRGAACDRLRKAMILDFNATFGVDANNLKPWQTLCRMLGVSPAPDKVRTCRLELSKIHVNIVNLLEAARNGTAIE